MAIAPVAPQIIPGRPPNAAVMKPTNTADQSPTIGLTPAMNEKAIASGTRRSATVTPERISSFTEPGFVIKASAISRKS